MKESKITIITVTFNAEKSIEKTILSVIGQTYNNIEYIIVDGLSKDNTMSIVEKYKDKIALIISEKDSGIYDAMNKGIIKSTGDFLFFLNSGDEIYENNTIEKIFLDINDEEIFYGKTSLINEDGSLKKITSIPKTLTHKSFLTGMPVSHQSIIIKKNLINLYDLKYKFVSDHDFIITALKKAKKVKNTNLIISKYQLGGFSDKNFFGCWFDKFLIVRKQFGFYALLPNYIAFLKEITKKIIKSFFLKKDNHSDK
ncbi:MAG TPA: glycosyltransferase family 2 protein [Spirochaetota bacterium]|nr:glycosyltransferase family 2 protein [Spirochaetota bacterium]